MDKILFKRGLRSALPTLDNGEMGFCTDTGEAFIGSPTGNIPLVTPAYVDNRVDERMTFINAMFPPVPWVACAGDGISDDAPTINALLGALPLNGGTLVLPAVHRINSTINIPRQSACKCVTILGGGVRGTSELVYYGGGVAINAVGITSDRVALYMRDISVRCAAAIVSQIGLNMAWNQYSGFDNVKFTQFYDGIVSGDNWCITFRDMTVSACSHNGFTSAGITNNLSFIGGTYTGNGNINLYLTGLNHRVIGPDVSGGGVYCIHMNNAKGCNIEVYLETPGTGAGIYLQACVGIVINGLCVSAWGDNTKLVYGNNCNGLTINGFSCLISGSSTAVAGSYGLYLEACHSVAINAPVLNNLATAIYIKDTRGLIIKPDFANNTTNIEFYNHTSVKIKVMMEYTQYAACIVPATAAPYIRWEFTDLLTHGTTANRPAVTVPCVKYFDDTLHKELTWDGAAWRDGAGAAV